MAKIGTKYQSSVCQKLAERLENPHVPSARLSGNTNRYKIKLRAAGYRLVYEAVDDVLIVYVIAVGKRENNQVYDVIEQRQPEPDETNLDDNL